MKQVLQNLRNGMTSVVNVPIPSPRPGTILVRTAASLVSAGTERMLVDFASKSLLGKAQARPDLLRQVLDKARREGLLTTIEGAFIRLDQPMPLGYSSAGVVVGVGQGVQQFQVGQRVACAGGGYAVHAEYNVVPVNLVAGLPDQVDDESAAFATLGAIALHGFRLANIQLGENVAIIGLGLLGLLATGIAQAAGCRVLGIDLDPLRVGLAEKLGAVAVLRDQAEEAAMHFSMGRGCDTVLICADTQTSDPIELAGAIARDRATVVAVGAVGLNIPRKIYYEKELHFVNSRSYGPGRYDPGYEENGRDYPIGYVRWTEGRNLQAIIDLLASGRMDVHTLITHRFPVEDAPAAYELITGKTKEHFLGVLLTYDQPSEQVSAEPGQVIESTLPVKTGGDMAGIFLGVLGAGNFAHAVLLPAVKKVPGIQPVAVASASGVSASHAARRFGFDYAASDDIHVIEDPQINTLAILTRHHLHARQVIAGLQAGKHVFCEKPLALNQTELDAIFEVMRTLGDHAPMLMVGFNRRFAPLAVQLHAFLASRQEPLVAHYRVNAGYIPLSHWVHDPEQGGGRIIGEGCHFIDLLTFLVGAPPLGVTSHAMPDRGRYREDNVVLTFNFPDGSLGTLTYLANGDKSFAKERLEVFSGGRVAVLDDFRSLELVQTGHRQVLRSLLRQDKGHIGEWQAFSNSLNHTGIAPIPYDQIYGVTMASFAALRALRTGQPQSLQA